MTQTLTVTRLKDSFHLDLSEECIWRAYDEQIKNKISCFANWRATLVRLRISRPRLHHVLKQFILLFAKVQCSYLQSKCATGPNIISLYSWGLRIKWLISIFANQSFVYSSENIQTISEII